MTNFARLFWIASLASTVVACAEDARSTTVDNVGANGSTDSDAGAANGGATAGGGTTNTTGGGEQPTTGSMPYDPNDRDGDKFTPEQGDCEDGSADINPGAYDYPGNDFDEDCDGVKAMPSEAPCDTGLAIDSTVAMDAAKAIGLCKTATEDGKTWGVIDARFVTADGTGTIEDAKMVGLLPEFGAAKVRAGQNMLALSNGVARAPNQQDYTEECDEFGVTCGFFGGDCNPKQKAPAGFPKGSKSCMDQMVGGPDTPAFNGAALQVRIRVPTNAKGFAFDSIFYSYEYPSFLCQKFNDFFIVTKEPKPELVPDGNILFDSNKEPIGVNTGLLTVCNPDDAKGFFGITPPPKVLDCSQGTALLAGTGFGAGESTCAIPADKGGASTGWLTTTAPAFRGEIIVLRFAIWDAGDATLDSTALIDNFVWSVNDPVIETKPVIQ